MATKYIKDIKVGDVLTNLEVEGNIVNDQTIIHVSTDNLEKLKPKKREAIPVALTSYAGTNEDEAYLVYAESKNNSLALEPDTEKIDCSSCLTHVSIKGSPQ